MYIELEIVSPLASNIKSFRNEASWGEVCKSLEQITGIERPLQVVECSKTDGKSIIVGEKDMTTSIGDWGAVTGCRVLISPQNGDSIVSQLADQGEEAEGFHLAEETYAKRATSVLQWKKQLGVQEEECNIYVGDRGSVSGKGECTVRFVGKVKELEDRVFLGVEWDSPQGKNDGSLKDGSRYFQCGMGFGSFIPPSRFKIGAVEEEYCQDEI